MLGETLRVAMVIASATTASTGDRCRCSARIHTRNVLTNCMRLESSAPQIARVIIGKT